jgi:hypothetical protein
VSTNPQKLLVRVEKNFLNESILVSKNSEFYNDFRSEEIIRENSPKI